ncbi:MAG: Pr6Pr family membrane protein [Antricoccus sp.]
MTSHNDTASRIARPWNLVTALLSTAALIIQLILVIRGVGVLTDENGPTVAAPERVLRFFSYFTVQSNILVILSCLTLVLAPQRDGRIWRVLRLDAIVGITVTIIVYHFALAPLLDLKGLASLTDITFHYVTPVLAIAGWLLFGPRPRIDRATLLWSLAWPALYFVYSLIRGAITNWYPYPFVDVTTIGYPRAFVNLLIVCVLLLGVGVLYRFGDAKLRPIPVDRKKLPAQP